MSYPASDWVGNARPGLTTPIVRTRDWLDARGKPAWLAAMVLGFILFWPVGLAILGYMIWSKRMFCSQPGASGRSHARHFTQPTGNSAFDAYREETLKRLEDENRQFADFLEKLREAKDKAEFDEFMRGNQAHKNDLGRDYGRDAGPQQDGTEAR